MDICWLTAMFFQRKHQVIVVDNFIKKKIELEFDLNHFSVNQVY